jgi:membrane-associated phospholipid phosphatase
MFESLENGAGLEIVVGLQSMGNPALDALALLLYLVGGFVFYLFVGTFFYWSVDKGLGKRLLIVLLVTGVLVAGLKLTFQRPRPYAAFPDQVSHVIEEGTYGIPSGHTAFALAWWGYLAWQTRKRAAWALVLVYTVLMAWGRMYIGAHYPQDIVGGLLVALVSLAICIRFPSGVVGAWNRLPFALRAALMLVLTIIITLEFGGDDFALVVAGVVPGAALGAYLEGRTLHFSTAGSRFQRLIRFILGVMLLASLFVLLWVSPVLARSEVLRQTLIYALIGAGVTVGWPWLGLRLGFFSRLQPLNGVSATHR